ncbi:MAG: hypothetical protein Q8P41_15050 [Pseudomonadota bacterium]|nr:hypothetical protein [Pseudomonadota bacterium]
MSPSSRSFRALCVLTAALSVSACSGNEAAPEAVVAAPAAVTAPAAPAAPAACNADAAWLTSTTPPSEIGGGIPIGDETNCQFQQFAWQWFLSLVQPAAAPGERMFETYPVLLPGVPNQCASPGPTGKAAAAKAMFVRTTKTADDSVVPVLPEDIKQAGSDEVLYDQAGNVVLYTVRYSPNEYQATSAGFQPNTVELKTSWRVMAANDPTLSSYYTMTADVTGFPDNPQTLALVGFHVVINTVNHPEFVWATFEHATNAPDCTSPEASPAAGWSFTSAAAANCLAQPGGCSTVQFNQGATGSSLTGTPAEVCRVYPDGTDPGSPTGGNNNDTNRFNIDMLNAQLVGPSGFLTQLPSDNPMSVWKNYSLVGSLWTSGGVASTEPSPGTVQRGSLELANTTMESFVQDAQTNCFSCHTYDPASPLAVSHIADDLLPSSTASKAATTTGASRDGAATTAPAQ